MFDLRLERTGWIGTGTREDAVFFLPLPLPPPFSRLPTTPLGRNLFLSPTFLCLKNPRWRPNISRRKFERSLAINTPALQAKNGSTWVFGPADSPWHQGAAESLIKAAKHAIHFSVSNEHLSVPEFLTVCCEVFSLLNERPIRVKPSVDSTIMFSHPTVHCWDGPLHLTP